MLLCDASLSARMCRSDLISFSFSWKSARSKYNGLRQRSVRSCDSA